ncbi:MAG: TIM barrel protein [Bryobacteraceae bacterium]
MNSFSRRSFLAAALAARALRAAVTAGVTRSRIGAISDEIADSPANAIAFAKQYGFQWFELRSVPGRKAANYFYMPEPELRAAAKEFSDNGIKISILDTNLLKFGLPGTEPVRRRPESPEGRVKRLAREQDEFDRRMDNLARCIRSAHILDCKLVRVFTFSRVEDPDSLLPRIGGILDEMANVAEKEGVNLAIENENSCNVAKCSEVAGIFKHMRSPAMAHNWDVLNGANAGEIPYPDGYNLLPKDRILNVQIKGKSILDYPEHLDWAPIMQALERGGYRGCYDLETHIFGPTQIQSSHASMKEILRLVEPA